jgi:type II secretion system protein L
MAQQALGIAYDPPTLTLVQLTGTAKTFRLTFVHQLALPQPTDPAEQVSQQRNAVQELVQTHHLRADTIVTTMPAHQAVLRTLEMPFQDSRRLRSVLKYALEDHMPFAPDDVVVDFQRLALPTSATRLLVAATPHQEIADHLALFQAGGLEPAMVDLDVFALANAALVGCDLLDTNAVLVNMHATRTLLTLLHKGIPVFARSVAQSVAVDPSLPMTTARLSQQVQQTLYACEHTLKTAYEPEVLVLSGAPSAQLDPLATALKNDLGLPTRVWRITTERYTPGPIPFPSEEQARYAVAFGAAARGLHRHAVGVNLRRERFARHHDIKALRGRVLGLGALLVCVIGLGVGNLLLQHRIVTQRYAHMRTDIARVLTELIPGTPLGQSTVQVRAKVRELDDRLRALGGVTGGQRSGLQLLRELSTRVPASLPVQVDHLTITPETIELSGTTSSYHDVAQLKEALEASPHFPTVKIGHPKTGPDNKTIVFTLTITMAHTREAAS